MKPNIVLLYCDQMQQKRLGFLDPIARTPHMDALKEESVFFSHAYTNQAQCSPSRAALVTGQPAHECGVMIIKGFHGHQNQLSGEEPMLAKECRKAGYRTVHFGKNHLYLPLDELGYDEGYIEDFIPVEEADIDRLAISYVPKSLQCDYLSLDKTEQWIDAYEQDEKPLFFVFSTNMPHPPFFSEENFIDNYSADKVKLDDSYYQEDFSSKPDFIREHAMDGSHGVPSEEKLRKELAQYYSMIEATDDHFGRVINGLKEKLDWDNTIVLLIADHGDMMGAHKMRMKGTLPYEELYRIPCLLKLPKHINSSRSEIDDLVDSPGFAASLLQLAGIDIPETFHAPCLAEAIARDRAPDDDHAFFEHYGAYWGIHPFYGIRTRKYKLINYFGDDDCLEFYDLEADPLELHNKADDPAYAAVVRELNGKATDWWEKTNGRDAAFYESDAFKEKGKAAF